MAKHTDLLFLTLHLFLPSSHHLISFRPLIAVMRSALAPAALSLLLAHGSTATSSWSNGHSGLVRRYNAARQINADSTTNTTEVEMVASAWYTGWHAADFPLANVSWDKYTQMTYAFG